jgi:chromosome segregation ATPase
MLKKTLMVGAGIALLAGLVFGRDAFSYIGTSMGLVKKTVKESVPIDFQIERARHMIKDLDPEIRNNMHLIAKEEVDVANLKQQLTESTRQVEKERRDIVRLKTDLEQGGSVFVYAGTSYSQKQVETDLARRFERFKTKEATVEKLNKIMNAREQGLLAANDKLKGMQAAKRQLEVEVENLKARVEMVRVAESTSNFNFDDSRLARTRDAIRDIAARIDVAEKMANASTTLPDQIRLDDPETKNVRDEITKYFNEHPAAEEIVKLD